MKKSHKNVNLSDKSNKLGKKRWQICEKSDKKWQSTEKKKSQTSFKKSHKKVTEIHKLVKKKKDTNYWKKWHTVTK